MALASCTSPPLLRSDIQCLAPRVSQLPLFLSGDERDACTLVFMVHACDRRHFGYGHHAHAPSSGPRFVHLGRLGIALVLENPICHWRLLAAIEVGLYFGGTYVSPPYI